MLLVFCLFYKIIISCIIKYVIEPQVKWMIRWLEMIGQRYSSIRSRIGLPWGFRSKEPACQCRRHKFDPWSGKIPHATEQLCPWATTTEPVLEPRNHDYWVQVVRLLKPALPEACLQQGSHLSEKSMHRNCSSPRSQLQKRTFSISIYIEVCVYVYVYMHIYRSKIVIV